MSITLHSFSALGLCLNTLGYNAHLSGFQRHGMVFKFNLHFTFNHEEKFICIGMIMPDKFTLNFDQFNLVIIQFLDNLRCPVFMENNANLSCKSLN